MLQFKKTFDNIKTELYQSDPGKITVFKLGF